VAYDVKQIQAYYLLLLSAVQMARMASSCPNPFGVAALGWFTSYHRFPFAAPARQRAPGICR
jgi:hypothetical protein